MRSGSERSGGRLDVPICGPSGVLHGGGAPRAAAQAEAQAQAEASCDSNYSGACLDPNASDYDCAGGSGDGPEYTGPVQVVGSDPYDLDSDGDGYACE